MGNVLFTRGMVVYLGYDFIPESLKSHTNFQSRYTGFGRVRGVYGETVELYALYEIPRGWFGHPVRVSLQDLIDLQADKGSTHG